MYSVVINEKQSNNMFDVARNIHFLPENSCLTNLLIKTKNAIIKNQIEKNRDNFPRTIVVTRSWIIPQNTKVAIVEIEAGNTFFKGL